MLRVPWTVQRVRGVARRLLSSLPEHRELTMPKVSPTMTHGRLVEWKFTEGDAFSEGDALADVETDKATMPVEAKDDGYLARILVPADTADIPLGQLLAITVEEAESVSAFANYQPPTTAPTKHSPAPPSAPDPAPSPTTTALPAASPIPPAQAMPRTAPSTAALAPFSGQVSPAVARLLNEFPAIDLNRIRPTGPKGIILKSDVVAAVTDGSAFGLFAATAPASSPAVQADVMYADVPVTSMRRAIARRLTESKQQIPHRYASIPYELDAILALRKRINAADPSPAVSVNDFIIRAVAVAMSRVPEMNAYWDAAAGMAVPNGAVDISFAVALEGGLITPIVKNADRLGLSAIALETKRLVGLARSGQLSPDEFEGGSFSVSNLGMFGVSNFSAIINPPQSGILAIGSGIPRAVPDDSAEFGIRKAIVGKGTVSTDARIVGEDVAGRFLREFSTCLTNPETMLL